MQKNVGKILILIECFLAIKGREKESSTIPRKKTKKRRGKINYDFSPPKVETRGKKPGNRRRRRPNQRQLEVK
jgi:hypothetical protein